MAVGEFAHAMTGNRIIGAPALADQEFARAGIRLVPVAEGAAPAAP